LAVTGCTLGERTSPKRGATSRFWSSCLKYLAGSTWPRRVNILAVLKLIDENRTIADTEGVRRYLAGVGIGYECWDLAPGIGNESTAEAILLAYDRQIERVKREGGYTKVDVVDVKASAPGLDAMLAKFSAEHWHDEDEVRFTLYGRGLYHVHPRSGSVVALEVRPGDMIRVPHGTLHWFDLCGEREIKAIRFFQDPAGWKPYYTESALEKQYQPLCFGPSYGLRPEQRLPAQIE
jgi:1,2-dihydroxy-3-keto-5-methylthiopentene dioxygenase